MTLIPDAVTELVPDAVRGLEAPEGRGRNSRFMCIFLAPKEPLTVVGWLG